MRELVRERTNRVTKQLELGTCGRLGVTAESGGKKEHMEHGEGHRRAQP